jgi:inosose dehydratase
MNLMKKNSIRFGCQTYTWQMSFDKYRGKMEHIISAVKASGMTGLEPEVCMLGDFRSKPDRLRNCLDSHGIGLGALCIACDWRDDRETPEEFDQANVVIQMLSNYFPGSLLVLCQMPGEDRQNLAVRQKNALACVNAVGARAADSGVVAAFHPNSPPGSIFRVEEDYNIVFDGLDSEKVGFAPDAGHIAKGGMDPVKIFRDSIALIRHVHFKDMDQSGKWIEMGRGCIDFQGIYKILQDSNYDGWIMVEDESELAEKDPDLATLLNGKYVAEHFK